MLVDVNVLVDVLVEVMVYPLVVVKVWKLVVVNELIDVSTKVCVLVLGAGSAL